MYIFIHDGKGEIKEGLYEESVLNEKHLIHSTLFLEYKSKNEFKKYFYKDIMVLLSKKLIINIAPLLEYLPKNKIRNIINYVETYINPTIYISRSFDGLEYHYYIFYTNITYINNNRLYSSKATTMSFNMLCSNIFMFLIKHNIVNVSKLIKIKLNFRVTNSILSNLKSMFKDVEIVNPFNVEGEDIIKFELPMKIKI